MGTGLKREHGTRSGTRPDERGRSRSGSSPASGQSEDVAEEIGQAARKRVAVELIRNHDPALRATARRYSICADDADDAYQRGIEILLSKAPTDNARRLLPWARTVIKHEALAVRKSRERILGRPGPPDREQESEDWVQLIPSSADGTDEQVAAREKVARSREALGTLKPAELLALTLLAQGFSYAEIASRCDWTRTKVNRCLAEGRQRFRSVFSESEAGERCAEFEPLLSASCDGEIDPDRITAVEDHLRACGHCRATLRAYRAAPRAAAALAPAIPMGSSLWEKIQELAVSAQVRFQSFGQGSSDSSIGAVAASGGTRGAGAAVLAKALAICAGTAGGAAVCVATGVVPAPELIDRGERSPAAKEAGQRPTPALAHPPDPARHPEPESSGDPVNTTPEPAAQAPVANAPSGPPPAVSPPPPTPTEAEFTPEAAGTPTPAAAPASSAPASAQSSSTSGGGVPLGGGGGEFAP